VFERNRLSRMRNFGSKGNQDSSVMDQVLQEVAIMKTVRSTARFILEFSPTAHTHMNNPFFPPSF
jgi:hypothetical protein